MILSEAYGQLRVRFKTHGAAAKYLGMTEQHYNALRNGRANIPPRTAEYIILKALEATPHELHLPPPAINHPPHQEAGG